MFKSIEEQTEKLKFLNFKICFSSQYEKDNLFVNGVGDKQKYFNYQIDSTSQTLKFKITGFTPRDKKQKIKFFLKYNGKPFSIKYISTFEITKQPYVKTTKLKNIDEIYLNGILLIKFTPKWFEHHILDAKYNLNNCCFSKTPDFQKETTFCIGDSFTAGTGVKEKETWPSMIDNSYNFGYEGLSHIGCYYNVKYVLENSKNVKRIICLMPVENRQHLKVNFLDRILHIKVHRNTDERLVPKELQLFVSKQKEKIFQNNCINDWKNTVQKIIAVCEKKNVKCYVSTWSQHLFKYIPSRNRLPVFPKLDIFSERGSDGKHPSKKHYKYWANQIKPYIDNF